MKYKTLQKFLLGATESCSKTIIIFVSAVQFKFWLQSRFLSPVQLALLLWFCVLGMSRPLFEWLVFLSRTASHQLSNWQCLRHISIGVYWCRSVSVFSSIVTSFVRLTIRCHTSVHYVIHNTLFYFNKTTKVWTLWAQTVQSGSIEVTANGHTEKKVSKEYNVCNAYTQHSSWIGVFCNTTLLLWQCLKMRSSTAKC